MSFSAELWQAITPIYAAILDHPFVRGLTDGSLSREAFRFYAVQDALYLRDFARALSIGPETMVMDFRPDQPMHNRYTVSHGFLSESAGLQTAARRSTRSSSRRCSRGSDRTIRWRS